MFQIPGDGAIFLFCFSFECIVCCKVQMCNMPTICQAMSGGETARFRYTRKYMHTTYAPTFERERDRGSAYHEWQISHERNRIEFGACYVNESQTRNQYGILALTNTNKCTNLCTVPTNTRRANNDVDGMWVLANERAATKKKTASETNAKRMCIVHQWKHSSSSSKRQKKKIRLRKENWVKSNALAHRRRHFCEFIRCTPTRLPHYHAANAKHTHTQIQLTVTMKWKEDKSFTMVLTKNALAKWAGVGHTRFKCVQFSVVVAIAYNKPSRRTIFNICAIALYPWECILYILCTPFMLRRSEFYVGILSEWMRLSILRVLREEATV